MKKLILSSALLVVVLYPLFGLNFYNHFFGWSVESSGESGWSHLRSTKSEKELANE